MAVMNHNGAGGGRRKPRETAGRISVTTSEARATRSAAEGAKGISYTAENLPDATPKLGRNDPCPCGSGRKWKRCCA